MRLKRLKTEKHALTSDICEEIDLTLNDLDLI